MTAETSNARGGWPERYACNGPEGTFWTDDAALANKLIAAAFDRDEWTVTDTQNPTAAPPPAAAESRGVVDGWRLVVRYGEYDSEPGVWAEKDGSLVWIAALAAAQQQEQVAPPSAPVGVDAPGSRAWMAEVCRAAALSLAAHGVRNDQLSKVADWIAQQPAAAGKESSKGADVARPKHRPYNASGSLSEYGVFPECDAQQPAAGAVDKVRFRKAPCYLCGYNGPGYYQPDTHPCAAKYHATQHQEPKP